MSNLIATFDEIVEKATDYKVKRDGDIKTIIAKINNQVLEYELVRRGYENHADLYALVK